MQKGATPMKPNSITAAGYIKINMFTGLIHFGQHSCVTHFNGTALMQRNWAAKIIK